MFGEAFIEPDDINIPGGNPHFITKPKNCAADLDLPDLEREGDFVGLKNQTATCYLNSLIQACFMSPEFRQTILNIPLCLETTEQPSDLLDNQSKQRLLLAYQKLFVNLKYGNCRSIWTEELTKSFGWENSEHTAQQDVQEANRVLFDALDRALRGTPYQSQLIDLYRGVIWDHITCLECQYSKGREDIYYDLILQVKGSSRLEESLMRFIDPEKLEGNNCYYCEVCQKKCEALKGIKLRTLPPILTFSLNRYEYDAYTGDRKKLNDRFEFGLELDMSPYTEQETENAIYELQTVLIHMGTAHGGHYKAYIRDVLGEGTWKQWFGQFQLEQQARKQKEQERTMDIEQPPIEPQQNETPVVQEQQPEKMEIEEAPEPEPQETKKGGKGGKNNKKGKGNKKQTKAAKQPKVEKQEKVREAVIDYDSIEFPAQTSNPDLSQNWYDFNDTTVAPIPVNRLQKQFGGSESAYILIYRRRGLPLYNTALSLPYLQKYVEEVNQAKLLERQVYEDAMNHIQIYVANPDILNLVDRKLPDRYDALTQATEFRLNLQTTVAETLAHIRDRFDLQGNFQLVEINETPFNRLVQYRRLLNDGNVLKTLSQLDVDHQSLWILFTDETQGILASLFDQIGIDKIPMRVNIMYLGQSKQTMLFSSQTLRQLKEQLSQEIGIPPEMQFVRNLTQSVALGDDSKSLAQLGVSDSTDLLVDQVSMEVEKFNGDVEEALGENFISILVERDDEHGVNKYFVDINQTLKSLIDEIYQKLNLEPTAKRRLRRLNGNTLFYKNEYPQTLAELNFQEGYHILINNQSGIRLCIERGEVPETGKIAIRYKVQSKHKVLTEKETKEDNFMEQVCEPSNSIKELKELICLEHSLKPEDHKMYRADWLDEPVEHFSKENLSLNTVRIKTSDLVILKDKESIVTAEFDRFQIYLTKTGLPDDSRYIMDITIKSDSTLGQLKSLLLNQELINIKGEADIRNLRLRELKKDYFFGVVFKNNDKQLKRFTINTGNLVCQFLDQPEDLTENETLLTLKRRNPKTRTYEGSTDLVFRTKTFTIQELKSQIKAQLVITDDLLLAKFTSHASTWIKLDYSEFESFHQTKKKKQPKKQSKRGKKQPKQENSDEDEKEYQIGAAENLKKQPYLLKESDFIGYLPKAEDPNGLDDFQTLEDEEQRLRIIKGKSKPNPRKRPIADQQGFSMNLDF